jgi:hypothetical protein
MTSNTQMFCLLFLECGMGMCNKKDENIKKNNNLNKQLLKKQKQKTI